MDARPAGLSLMLITLPYRLQFGFKVTFKPNLVSVGTQRIATSGNARVKVFLTNLGVILRQTCFLGIGPARENFRPKSARPGGILRPSRPGP